MTRLVIFAPNWLGDAVMALPAIADVRRGSPGTPITVIGRPVVAQLFRLVGDVDDVLENGVVENGVGRLFFAKSERSVFATSERLPFDAALLLPNSFRSALVARGAGIQERWGYRADCRGPLLTKAIARPVGVHQVEYYQHLVRALGFPSGPTEPRIAVTADARAAGARTLREAGWDGSSPVVAFAPGAAYGGAKRWPPAYFAELASTLAGDGVQTVLVGSAADAAAGRQIEAALGRPGLALNLIGRTDVAALAAVLVNARALVSNDSGAMHLGAAVGVPIAAVFGPTDERMTSPRSIAPADVLTHPVWCRPCGLRECPLDHRCMRGVKVAAVAASARRML